MTTITLSLSKADAQLVRLALLYLIRERKQAPAHAAMLAEADRDGFIRDMAADAKDMESIVADINNALDPRAARDAHDARTTVVLSGLHCEHHATHAAAGGSAQRSAEAHRQMAAAHSRIAFETATRYHAGLRA